MPGHLHAFACAFFWSNNRVPLAPAAFTLIGIFNDLPVVNHNL